MAGKKSNARIKRMMKRAEARGEVYTPPQYDADKGMNDKEGNGRLEKETEEHKEKTQQAPPALSADKVKLKAAQTLQESLDRIQADTNLKSKDRRSAKRKAEAIAAEESGYSASELILWYDEYKQQKENKEQDNHTQNSSKGSKRKKRNPYIVFVGQLSYETSKVAIFRHFQKELGEEFDISEETVMVRLLTDQKTKKSRGMAFVEVNDPELLYACLKLHHTFLEGRRINVERSAGGKSNSEARKSKIQKLRSDQTEHFNSVIDSVFSEYYENGSIQKRELDDGVVALCKRHSASVVQAALEEYVEKHGCDMDNSSAYLTFLLGKMAEEGVRKKDSNGENSQKRSKETPERRTRV